MKSHCPNFLVVVAVAVGGALFAPGAVFAHKMEVSVTASPQDPTHIRIYAGYEYGDASDSSTVTMTNTMGKEVARATTDPDGECFLPRPTSGGTFTITVDDGAGHRESVILTLPPDVTITASSATAARSRSLMAVVGLVAIAGLTLAAKRLTRRAVSATE